MKNRKWLLLVALVLSVAMATTGTLAYLTDDDADVNTMTLGKVEIVQNEQEWNADETALQQFTQDKPLLPYVGKLGWENKDEANGAYRRFTMSNVVDKYVTVTNTGKSDAYVRTIIALEMGDYTYEEFANIMGASINMINGSEFKFTGAWEWTHDFVAAIDGRNYNIMVAVHDDVVAPGETTIPSLLQVYLSKDADNEAVEKLDGNKNEKYDILVLSQAIQATGFEGLGEEAGVTGVSYAKDAAYALNAGFGEATEENVAEWFGGMSLYYVDVDGEKVTIEGADAAEILDALKNGTDILVGENVDVLAFDTNSVDAQGATVTMSGVGPEAYGYLAFLPDAGEDVYVSNLNVTGSGFVEVGHYGQGGGTYTLENVKIVNLASTLKNTDKGFTLACGFMHYGNATLNNCVMTGTTAIQEGAMPVDLASANGFTTVVNGGEYGTIYCWSHAYTTINGAEVDTIYTAPIKGTTTIKAGTHVGTLNIDYGTAASYATETNLAKIVIEDGATVDAIIFNGTTYTLTEWNAR